MAEGRRAGLRDGEHARPLVRALYPVAALLVVIPFFDLISTAWPLQPGTLQWRYGFLGLLANVLMTPLLGVVLASVAAASLGHSGTLRVVSVLWLIGAALLLAAVVLFALDVLQLQPQVADQQVTNYRAGSSIAAGKFLLSIVALVWLGIGGLQTVRRMTAETRI